MRTTVVLIIAAVLGCLFLVQKRHEPAAPSAAPAVAQKAASPRPVSEHNWAKRSLDTTRKVTDQVSKQRQEDGTRK